MCSVTFKELRKKRARSTESHWKKPKEEWVNGLYIVFASVSVYFLLEYRPMPQPLHLSISTLTFNGIVTKNTYR